MAETVPMRLWNKLRQGLQALCMSMHRVAFKLFFMLLQTSSRPLWLSSLAYPALLLQVLTLAMRQPQPTGGHCLAIAMPAAL